MSDNQNKSAPRGVVSWIFGIAFMFLGFLCFIGSAVAAVAFLAIAALLLPPMRQHLASIRINPSRIVRGLLIAVLIVVALVGIGVKLPDTNPSVKYEPREEQPATQQAEKEIAYEVVERWEIPNGGEGKVIVISHDLLNETDMDRLGRKLYEDTRGDRNAVIQIFDDAKSAALYPSVGKQQVSEADSDEYLGHFVGQYVRNANTGYHALDIHFDGMAGTNSKTIKY